MTLAETNGKFIVMLNFKSLLLLALSLLLSGTSVRAQKVLGDDFNFPKSEIGVFSKAWFKAVNAGQPELLADYKLREDDWEDYFKTMIDLINRVEGISPKMIAYQTDRSISIYSKETSGRWVLVNLALNAKNGIEAMGIKKSYMPNNHRLENGMSRIQVHKLVRAVATELKKGYVLRERRADLESFLLEGLESGKYDNIKQCDLLALSLSKDLVRYANDKHLQVIPPSRQSEVAIRFGTTADGETSKQALHTTSDDHLEEKLPISGKMLDNGVGYIQIERFMDAKPVISETERIMEALKVSKAVIVDLRQSGGGDGRAVNDLLAYFFAQGEPLDQGKVFHKPLSMVYKNKPLYVLTSKRSISAAEGFAYFLKQRKRATLIGQTTAGAGYLVDAYKLPFDFYLVNSIATNFDQNAKAGWQGRGVQPDIETSAGEALERALSLIR